MHNTQPNTRRPSPTRWAVSALALSALACNPVSSSITMENTPTVVPPTETKTMLPTATLNAAATAAVEQAATETAQADKTATAVVRVTVAAATRVARTEVARVEATTQAEPMFAALQQLEAEGHIGSTAGQYHAIPNFLESWAQLNYYTFWYTGYEPNNFVLRAKTSWESASDRADWWTSGCGFVFRAKDDNNHYIVFLALDGYVYFAGFRDGIFFDLNRGYSGRVDTLQGEAEIMLVVVDNKFTYFVNEERVISVVDDRFASGALAQTLVSGTNKGFGTRCKMIDVELWELD